MRVAVLMRGWRPAASLALAICLGACSGAHEQAQRGTEPGRPRTSAGIKPTANVPALLGQSIESLRRQLGPTLSIPKVLNDSARLAELTPRATDSLLAFRTGGLLLLASYDIRTRQLNDLLLLGHHEDSLMSRAALRPDALTYIVLPAFRTKRPGKLLGLRVIPVQR